MGNLTIGPTLSAIGQMIFERAGDMSAGALLYAEIQSGKVADCSIHARRPKQIERIDCDQQLSQIIARLWRMEQPDQRWATITYTIKGVKFDTHFDYPEDLALTETFQTRERRAVEAALGRKAARRGH